jgi:hypothetical protein
MPNPHDPLGGIPDAPLFVVPRMLEQLRRYAPAPLPEGAAADAARAELSRLAERLLAGIEGRPTRSWVMTQFRQSLAAIRHDRPEAHGYMVEEVKRLAGITGAGDVAGPLGEY